MDKYRQQYSRNNQRNTGKCGCQNNTGCGCQKAYVGKTTGYRGVADDVVMKCKCDCNCTMEKVLDAYCPASDEDPIAGMPLAMAYVPWQQFDNVYSECEAVYHGTIFPELDLGFYGLRCR